jgi:predicted GNAT family acetyltransferase
LKWTLASQIDLNSLLDFILEKEWEHTFFTSRLIENGVFTLPSRSRFPILILKEKSRIKAACMITTWGGLFPVFKSIDLPDEKELKELVAALNKNLKHIYSIMGTEERVQLLKKQLNLNQGKQINYNLMVKEFNYLKPLKPDIKDLQIKKATPDDSASLLGLELEYQKEEVFLDISNINTTQIYHNLRNTLYTQEIYYACRGIIPIAKAGTNAIGHKWNQIGGVFTEKKDRGQGLSTWLMNYLLEQIEKDGKKTVLFVKENNSAAEKVYNKLGFIIKKKFNIIYFI